MAIWIATRPTINDRWADVDDVISDNWQTYGQATSAEHGTLGSTASGRHFMYAPGTCYYGSTTDIAALTSPPCGALAYDSSVGYLKRYWNGGWAATTSAGRSRARWYLSANNSMGSVDGNTQTVGLSLTSKDGVNFDTYSEYACGKGAYIASADGYYLFAAQVTMASSASTSNTCAGSAITDLQTEFTRPTFVSYGVPTADGTISSKTYCVEYPNDGTYYDKIDEAYGSHDDATTYIKFTSTNISANFATSKISVPSGPTYSVSIYARNHASFAAARLSGALVMTNGLTSTWKNVSLTVDTTDYYDGWSSAWSVNPNTSSAWTHDEIEGTDSTNGLSGIVLRSGGTGYGTVWITNAMISATWSYSNNYQYIDEYPTNDDGDYLSASVGVSNTYTDSFSATNFGGAPTLASKISATVYVRASRGAGGIPYVGAVLRMSDGVAYSGHSYGAPTCAINAVGFVNYTFVLAKNPVTDAAWTAAQINGTAAGQSLTGFGYYCSGSVGTAPIYISQAYAKVDWEQPDPKTTLDVWKYYGVGATSAIAARGRVIQPQVGVMRNDTVRAMGVTQLTAGGHLTCWVTKTLDDDTILSGTDKTFMTVHRMGSSCL